MSTLLRELIQYKDLLFMLTWRDIRLRYKQSIMGFLWALFMPIVIIFAGLLVRKAFSILSGNPMELFELVSVSVKALPWAFFVGSIRFATNSLTSNPDFITKIYFPREVFPISSVLTHLFDFAVASGVLVVILTIAGIGVTIHLLWLPFLLFILVLLTVGIALFLSCANLFFRDVKYIVEILLTFGIFFTPVFYEASMFREWAPILLLNPIAPILEGINDIIVLHRPPAVIWLTYSGCCGVLVFFVSNRIFARAEEAFAEYI